MIANFQVFLFWLATTWVLYLLIPKSAPRVRQWMLIGMSLLLIFAAAPWAAGILLGLSVFATASGTVWTRGKNIYLFVFGLAVVLLPLMLTRAMFESNFLVKAGVTFMTLKSVAVFIDSYTKGKRVSLADVLLLNSFFPIYAAGPVAKLDSFVKENMQNDITWENVWAGSQRMVLGIFKAAFICEALIAPTLEKYWGGFHENPHAYSVGGTYLFVLLKFAYTYLNFCGYSDVAIGAGKVFSFKITENFNYPLLARNLQDYWRRWHISLGNWVMQYLFFPVFASIRKPWGMQVAIILSFFLIGLWHEFTLTYMAWGLLHGVGLATVQTVRQLGGKKEWYKSLQSNWAFVGVSMACTVFFAAWVQTFANSPDLSSAAAMSLRLIGL